MLVRRWLGVIELAGFLESAPLVLYIELAICRPCSSSDGADVKIQTADDCMYFACIFAYLHLTGPHWQAIRIQGWLSLHRVAEATSARHNTKSLIY